jgi:hypothetical protein
LQRELALPARDCKLLGRTAALVIDRYFEDVRWPGRPPRLQALPRDREALPPPPLPDALPPVPERPSPLAQEAPAKRAEKGPSSQSAAGADQARREAALSSETAERKAAAEKAAAEKAAAEKAAAEKAAAEKAAAEKAAAEKAAAEKAAAEKAAAEKATPAAQAEPGPPEPLHLALLAGPGLYLGRTDDLRFAVSAAALLRRGGLQFGLSLAGTARSTQPVDTRGQTQVRTGLATVSAALCGDASLLRLCGGPAAALRLSFGSLSGAQIAVPGSATIVQLAVGGHATAGLRLTDRLELSLELQALFTPGEARFDVAGGPSRTLSSLDLTWALRLGWLAF